MNRQTPVAQRTAQIPSSYRQSPSSNPNPMYYATAGAQTTSQQPSSRGASTGQLPAGFPSGGVARGGPAPPGFSSRTAGDTSEFPALGGGSSYASQAQQSGIFMSQGGPGQLPGPPPGISAPAAGQGQSNGLRDENSRGEEFPALGGMSGNGAVSSEAKDRIPNFLRNHGQHAQAPPSPPSTLPNGASGSHTSSSAPSNNPQQHMSGTMQGGDMSWLRQSPSRGLEQITRPVQQILSSPVDKWGLQALLYEIKMGKGDRALLMFGEDLSQLGVDLEQQNALYPTFVTPWLDASQASQQTIEDIFETPSYYTQFKAPPLATKLTSLSEETLFYIFYSSPEDLSQLEAADELYIRGWRYHIPNQVWISGPTIALFDPREKPPTPDTPLLRGPVVVFDWQKFERQAIPEIQLHPFDFEPTKTVAQALSEQQEQKRGQPQGKDVKSPMTNESHLLPNPARGTTASTVSSRS